MRALTADEQKIMWKAIQKFALDLRKRGIYDYMPIRSDVEQMRPILSSFRPDISNVWAYQYARDITIMVQVNYNDDGIIEEATLVRALTWYNFYAK